MKTILLPIIIILLLSLQGYAQPDNLRIEPDDAPEYTNVTPPSPIAYELGKYGQIPVSEFSGTPNINIPIYTFMAGDLSVPISLSYYSNGIKVDQLSSNVGLGWSINMGGVISRSVRDEPDDELYQYYPKDRIDNPYDPASMEYFIAATGYQMDSEADIFSFNFMGHTGKFIYGNDKSIIMTPVQDIKIQKSVDGFRITDSKGVIYDFTAIEINSTQRQLLTKEGNGSTELNPPMTTAWYLTSMTNTTGDQITFEYESNDYLLYSSIDQNWARSWNLSNGCETASCGARNELTTYRNIIHFYGSRLAKIRSNRSDEGFVRFTYQIEHPNVTNYKLISEINVLNKDSVNIQKFNLGYLTTSNSRIFLRQVTFTDTLQKYIFEYNNPEGLPERLSYSQDHWGYFNGASNQNMLPDIGNELFYGYYNLANRDPNGTVSGFGILKKITYPTQGTSILQWEPNSYQGVEIITPAIDHLYLEAYNFYYPLTGAFDSTEVIQFTHRAYIHCGVYKDTVNGCDVFPQDPYATLTVQDQNNNLIMVTKYSQNYGWISEDNPIRIIEDENNVFSFICQENKYYKFTLTTSRPCVRASVTIDYYSEGQQYVNAEIETGGLRIKRIIDKDIVTESEDTTRFYYNKLSKLQESSGVLAATPAYLSPRTQRLGCSIPCSFYDCEYFVLQSTSHTNLFNTSGNNIYYEYVTKSFGNDNFENGGETNQFRIHLSTQGNNIVGDGLLQSPSAWNNYGWDNGLKLKTDTYKIHESELQLARSESFEYTNDPRLTDTITSYAITKNFDLICSTPTKYICKQNDIDDVKMGWRCTNTSTEHKHSWAIISNSPFCINPPCIVNPFACISSSHNVWDTMYCHPCVGHSVGDTVVFTDAIENLNIIEYEDVATWNYLSKSTVKEYNSNSSSYVTSVTEYSYDNPEHMQVSSIKTHSSKGDTIFQQLYYPKDYDTVLFADLNQKHILSKPIDKRQLNNNKLTNGQLFHYNENGQPTQIDQATSEIMATLPFYSSNAYSYGEPETYLEYDTASNKLISFHNTDDLETVIVWGYQYGKPIAQIVNATPELVETALGQLNTTYNDLQAMTNAELSELFIEMRALNSLEDAQITSYTYTPLVGLTSVTDANGISTSYQYDSYGRLKCIIDRDGNILKKLDYHYQE